VKYLETLLMQYRVEDIRNNYNGLMHLALEIIKGEDTVDKKLLKDLIWIKDHTTERLNTNYFMVVQTIARRIVFPLTFPVEVKVSMRRTKEFELGELIAQMEEAHIRINEIVREVAKKYSLDIQIGGIGGGSVQLPVITMEKS
jgi:hypothetical protein